MNAKLIESIANAVLYEGYMLYPYRPSSVKNQQRWNFGVIYPKAYSEIQRGNDICVMQTQCLMRGDADAEIEITVRFLQCIARKIGVPRGPGKRAAGAPNSDIEIVDSFTIDGQELQSWQEASERAVTVAPMRIANLLSASIRHEFEFAGGQDREPVQSSAGSTEAFIVREQEPIRGCVDVSAERVADGVYRLSVALANLTDLEMPHVQTRQSVLLKSLLSAHTVLSVTSGEFVSQIDPPAELQAAAGKCRNVGTWPVMIGDENARDAMLSSPIILYDYPEIAPESTGDLFDGTEIDEILALRILTLSDDEKREIRQSDARTREVLERTESMPVEHFMKLHGVLRGMRPADTSLAGGFKNEEDR
ncbi:MAG: hypothetical protein WB985_13945 [Candidatus Acidiferrales bacterium]